MKIPALFKEYIWLLETINRYGKISFAEIDAMICQADCLEGVISCTRRQYHNPN